MHSYSVVNSFNGQKMKTKWVLKPKHSSTDQSTFIEFKCMYIKQNQKKRTLKKINKISASREYSKKQCQHTPFVLLPFAFFPTIVECKSV